jgi:hypothetical protein
MSRFANKVRARRITYSPNDRPRDLSLKERNEFHELANYVLGRLRRAPGNGQVRGSVYMGGPDLPLRKGSAKF